MRSLIVEDSASVRLLVEALLQERGHDVVSVESAEAAWKEHVAASFDLLIVDCILPGRPGTDLTKLVRRARGGDTPVILMMTGENGSSDLEAILDSGADDFLAKPFEIDQFHTRLLIAERHVSERRRRQRVEDALHGSEGALRSLIDSSPDPVVVHAKGVVTYVNPAALRTLGHPNVEVLRGRNLLELVHPEDRTQLDPERTSESPSEFSRVSETRIAHSDGGHISTEVVRLPIVFGGRPSELLMMRDITAQKELQAKMLQADRLASVGTLAAGVAHELNNPLAYVVSNVRLLAEELVRLEGRLSVEEMTTLRELVEETAQGTKRMGHIVRDLKTFSRADDEMRGPMDLGRIVTSSINMVWNQLRHSAKLIKELGPTPRVDANESRLGQVIVNLLVNAAQALPEGRHTNEVRVRTWRDERGWALLAIEDNGSGISPAVMEHIYDPFFTTKPAGEGTGLGLSIVRNIVRGAGGELTIDSEVDVGTRVTVALPPGKRARRVSSGLRSRASSALSRAHVLVVDDEPLVGKSLQRALRDHLVVVVTDGEEAVERLIGSEHFDVVLCDLMMPGVTGMDVFERVRRARPQLSDTFVFMTGGAFTPRGRAFLDAVANEYIEKPFDLQIVRSIVRQRAGGVPT